MQKQMPHAVHYQQYLAIHLFAAFFDPLMQ